MDGNNPTAPPDRRPKSGSRLWIWFVAAFLVQLGAWATWLVIASRHRVQEVPLVQQR